MTREEVLINHIQEYLDNGRWVYESCYLNEVDLRIIIKALKQAPCEDCISRQAVIDLAEWFDLNPQHFSVANLIDEVENMPSINPQESKMGHWIRVTDKAGYFVWECDKCGWQQRFYTKYCPDCGAKMEG